jgi:3-methyladenine DNA glycosylase AlkD
VPTIECILKELESLGSEQTRKTYRRHGAPEPMYGVKVGDLKKVAKKIKNQQEIALGLYDTGNIDAMYLAGIVADGSQMTKTELDRWARQATWQMISDYSIPGVAAESQHGLALARKWMKSKKPMIASAGWCTYSAILATWDDDVLNIAEITALLNQVVQEVHTAPNRVRYAMNNYVISVGTYIAPLLKAAKQAAKKIGPVTVDMGDTACKVPLAVDYIAKVESMNRVGKKRKTAKC